MIFILLQISFVSLYPILFKKNFLCAIDFSTMIIKRKYSKIEKNNYLINNILSIQLKTKNFSKKKKVIGTLSKDYDVLASSTGICFFLRPLFDFDVVAQSL